MKHCKYVPVNRVVLGLALPAAMLGTVMGSTTWASAAPAKGTPVIYNLGNNGNWNKAERKPVIFYLAADGSAALGDTAHHVRWSKWAAKTATGKGRYYYRTGPCCKYKSDAVTITANDVKKSYFEKLTIKFAKTSVTLEYKQVSGLGYWQVVSGRYPQTMQGSIAIRPASGPSA
jgi:hypothetical protein